MDEGKNQDGQKAQLFVKPSSSSETRKLLLGLLTHYRQFMNLDREMAKVLAEDWIRALKPYRSDMIAAAKDAWLRDPDKGTRPPTIADIVGLCGRITSGPGGALGTVPESLWPISPDPFGKLSPAQKWSWYARAHAWCELVGAEPRFDMSGRFRDDGLVQQAIAEIQGEGCRAERLAAIKRAMVGDPRRLPLIEDKPRDPATVRPHWRRLARFCMSPAEETLSDADLQRLPRVKPKRSIGAHRIPSRNEELGEIRSRLPDVTVPSDIHLPPEQRWQPQPESQPEEDPSCSTTSR